MRPLRVLFFVPLALLIHLFVIALFLARFDPDRQGPLGGGGVAVSTGAVSTGEVVLVDFPQPQALGLGKNSRGEPPRGAPPQKSSEQLIEGRTGLGAGLGGDDPVLGLIRRRIESAKSYPFAARRSQQEGTVLVEFEIDPEGNLRQIKLVQSSRYPLLDEETLKTIRRAAPFPAYDRPIRLAVRFSLHPDE